MGIAPILAIIVTIATGWMVIKRFQTHIVLFAAGLILTSIAILCGKTSILPKGVPSTGLVWFDMVDLLRVVSTRQITNIGLIIMSAGGFAKYMETIGASGALVSVSIAPLKKLKSPYLVLSLCYLLGQCISPVVPSHGGLSMLLLTTIYPVLSALGLSPAAAAAAIFCSGSIGMGPGTGTAIFAAKIAGVEPIVYFVKYQIPIAACIMATIAVLNVFVQSYFDRKNDDVYENATVGSAENMPIGPKFYAFMPVLPIVLLCVFSQLGYQKIQLTTVTALFLSWIVGVIIELIRLRDARKVFKDAMAMLKTMGTVFGSIVALIIAAEIFATGLRLTGLIDLVLKGAQAGGFGVTAMSGLLSGLIALVTFLTGSGVGAMTSFGSLATDVAAGLGGDVTQLVSSMQFTANLSRCLSPVAGATIIVASAVGITPVAIIRRTIVPISAAWVVMMVGNYFLFN